jgi:hypothetical protein
MKTVVGLNLEVKQDKVSGGPCMDMDSDWLLIIKISFITVPPTLLHKE